MSHSVAKTERLRSCVKGDAAAMHHMGKIQFTVLLKVLQGVKKKNLYTCSMYNMLKLVRCI